jgi:sugar phosphate isomerase/epimerase
VSPHSERGPARQGGRLVGVLASVAIIAGFQATVRASPPGPAGAGLWAHDNLVAWCVVPFDAARRGPEARAAMLEDLGFRQFAYDWRDRDIPTFDAEIDALQRHHVGLLAWWFPLAAEDPKALPILETFRRHGVRPQLWFASMDAAVPRTPGEQAQFVEAAARRVAALERLAAPYGCRVELYNHNGWFGREENELAVLESLRRQGIADVGMVYNFSHCRDSAHDDSRQFPALWARIKDHVVAVNVTGLYREGVLVYPSQGDSELEMMRTIQHSGWTGPIGVIAEKGGDAQQTLGNYVKGLDWLAAELREPGSGGPRPFGGPVAPAPKPGLNRGEKLKP